MRKFIIAGLMIMGLSMLAGTSASAAEFSAVLFSRVPTGVYPQDTLTPNFWAKGEIYRYQGDYKERPMMFISNRETDTVLYFEVDNKIYRPFVRSAKAVPDPIQMWNDYFKDLKKEELGTEVIRGYTCTKYKYVSENKLWAEVWDCPELGHFIKLIMHYAQGMNVSVELVSIKEGPVADSLFQIPEGYKEGEQVAPDMTPPQPQLKKIKND